MGLFAHLDTVKVIETLFAIFLSTFAGLTRTLYYWREEKNPILIMVSNLMMSAFAGYMFILMARSMNLPFEGVGICAGMAGWMGPRVLDLMEAKVMNWLGLEIESNRFKQVERRR